MFGFLRLSAKEWNIQGVGPGRFARWFPFVCQVQTEKLSTYLIIIGAGIPGDVNIAVRLF
jgi:hypothetical protein